MRNGPLRGAVSRLIRLSAVQAAGRRARPIWDGHAKDGPEVQEHADAERLSNPLGEPLTHTP